MSEQTPAGGRYCAGAWRRLPDYQSPTEDLTFNSKPHINMLTILAEENLPFAKEILSLSSRPKPPRFLYTLQPPILLTTP